MIRPIAAAAATAALACILAPPAGADPLDGAYLGDPVARLAPHALEITRLSDLGSDHTLAVEINDDASSGSISGHRRNWPLRTGLTGPVRIERKVEALQSSRGGRAIFVRTTEGAVLAAPLAKAETESTAE